MDPGSFLKTFWQERASAILRTDDQEVARQAMQAAVDGGFRVIEFTLSVPGAFELIEEFAAKPDLVVGAGTVLTVEEAERTVASGGCFIVSPVMDPEVIAAARHLGVAAMPGTHTATEMLRAQQAGAPLQKLFPAPAGGPMYVKAMLGPMPFLRIVPTNGVDGDNVNEWIAAGAFAVGYVNPLFDPADLAAGRFEAIRDRASYFVAATRAVERPARDWSFG